MNPELYERYLAKKAKKLGISVEELKAQGTSSPVKETATTSTSQATQGATQSSVSSNYTQPSVQPQPVPQPQYPLPEQTQYQTQSQVAQPQSQSQFASQSQTQYYSQPQYVQQTIQEQLAQQQTQQTQMPLQQPTTQFNTSTQSQFVQSVQPQQPTSQYEQVQQEQIPQHVEYSGMRQETVKTEVPSYIFGPSKMTESPKYSSSPINQPKKPEIPDNRENKFGLIGYPLGHSLSKVIHEAGFKSLGIQATYDILETPPDTLVDRVKFLKGSGYKGFNVTIPLKLPISLFVNEVDKYADLARAVNTIYIEPDKSLKAYNTDVIGFRRAIPKDVDVRGKSVAILGTGGAAHAACVALAECRVREIAFFTRNIPNSIDLMNYVRRKFPSIEFNVYQIENIRTLSEFSMIVNTTPIGMLGKAGDMMPVDEKALATMSRDAVVYDVIYNPKKTVLIRCAEKLGLRTITGLDMLIYQAVAAQEIWFGQTPDFKDMKIAALEAL